MVPGIDGNTWIKTARQKTDVKVAIPLLPMALEILNKYRDEQMQVISRRLFPSISNQKMNQYLKEIASRSGISKKITFHLARHTFATTVTLNNGVRLETVSRLLGHSKLATTQLYAHVLDKMIGEEMDLVKTRYAVMNPKLAKSARNQ
ncbi:MAG: site-specific integrase [Chitinophagaceae bacterium]